MNPDSFDLSDFEPVGGCPMWACADCHQKIDGTDGSLHLGANRQHFAKVAFLECDHCRSLTSCFACDCSPSSSKAPFRSCMYCKVRFHECSQERCQPVEIYTHGINAVTLGWIHNGCISNWKLRTKLNVKTGMPVPDRGTVLRGCTQILAEIRELQSERL